MSQTIEFTANNPRWSNDRVSLLIDMIVNDSRTVTCLLPYEVAMDGQLDGRNREASVRAYFVQNRNQIERVARNLIESGNIEVAGDLGEFVRILQL